MIFVIELKQQLKHSLLNEEDTAEIANFKEKVLKG